MALLERCGTASGSSLAGTVALAFSYDKNLEEQPPSCHPTRVGRAIAVVAWAWVFALVQAVCMSQQFRGGACAVSSGGGGGSSAMRDRSAT